MAFMKTAGLVLVTAILVALAPRLLRPKVPQTIYGSCTQDFVAVKDAFK